MQRYKQHAAELELEKIRRRQLDGDVPGQMSNYLEQLGKDYDVLQLKVLDNHHLQSKNNRNQAHRSANPYESKVSFAEDNFDGKNLMPKKRPNGKGGGVVDVDLRPTINYKMIEPMQNIDPAVIMNKRIDKLNQ